MIMTLSADRTDRIGRSENREEIVEFSPEILRAPFALRCGAAIIDYILVVAVPVLGLIFNKLIAGQYGGQSALSNNTAWLIAFLLGISDLFIFPCLSGQTLGKMVTGLRIVKRSGRQPSAKRIILRNTIGFLASMLTLGFGFALAALVAMVARFMIPIWQQWSSAQ